MKLSPRSIAFMLAAVAVTAPAVRAALPGAIDDGVPEPRHGSSADPGPPVETLPPSKTGRRGGDAEPAPVAAPALAPSSPSAPPPSPHPSLRPDEPIPGPRHRIAVMPRFGYRLGDAGRAIPPASGFGLAGTYEFRYVRVGQVIEAALGVDFAFDRFARGEQGTCSGEFTGRQECLGGASTFSSTRVITETSFVLVHTVAARVGLMRPYFTLGSGFGVGYFNSIQMDLQPGNETDVHLLGRVTIGVDVTLGHRWSATLRGDYTAVRRVSPFVTGAGRTLPLFGDLVDVGAGVAYSF